MNVHIITPQSFVDALDAVFPQQHDAHALAYARFRAAYGNQEGYHLAMADKARANARLMLTAEGRTFIARRNASHAAYRASRAGLPF